MAKRVAEIMNRELFSIPDDARAKEVVGTLLAVGITGAPILDAEHRPIGFASLRDLLGAADDARVRIVMTQPADVVDELATIEEAADLLSDNGRHHLVVVNDDGRAVGFVGALDVIAGLRGHPVRHPSAFPHHDAATGLSWTDDTPLTMEGVQDAPDGPGLYVLVSSEAGKADRVVWSEASHNVRERLIDMLAVPRSAPPHLSGLIDAGALRFRAAGAPSARALLEAVEHSRSASSP